MLEQLFGIRYTVLVDGKVYGYTLHRQGEGRSTYTARVVEITPVGDFAFGAYTVPTFGHKESVSVAILDQLFTMESV